MSAEYVITGEVSGQDIADAKAAYDLAFFNMQRAAKNAWYEFWDWGEYSRLKTICEEAERRYLQLKAAYENDQSQVVSGGSSGFSGMMFIILVALAVAGLIVYKILKS